MKKLVLLGCSLLILTACQSHKDTKQGITVEDIKSTQSSTTKQTETTPFSKTETDKTATTKKDWKVYFSPTIAAYQSVISKAKAQETPPTAQNNDEQIAFSLISDSVRVSHLNPQYTYYDINKDDIPELLIGNNGYVTTIYYLNNEIPNIIKAAGVASSGGFRAGLEIKEDGTIIYTSGTSLSPDWTASAYQINNQNLVLLKEAPYQMGSGADIYQLLGINNSQAIDPSQLEWITF